MEHITGGVLLARALANEGIKFVFDLQCPEMDPLLAALEGKGMRFVAIRHEATAVHMAEGQWTMDIPNEMPRWGKTFCTGMGGELSVPESVLGRFFEVYFGPSA